jgi:hypothetical protein
VRRSGSVSVGRYATLIAFTLFVLGGSAELEVAPEGPFVYWIRNHSDTFYMISIMIGVGSKRFLLTIAGPGVDSQELGYRTSAVQNLHLTGVTLRVGEDTKDHGLLLLGPSIIINHWYRQGVLDAFSEMESIIADSEYKLVQPLLSFCFVLFFIVIAAERSEGEISFNVAKAIFMERLFEKKLGLRR